jgi:4-amino-4-deoxy-L-arabinose transferase-like glycosyltransferase
MNPTEQKPNVSDNLKKYQGFLFPAVTCLLFGLFAFQLWFHATRTSATIDEPAHILAGHRYWQCGDFGINPEHPPLLKLLATAPLNFRQFSEPNWDCGSRITPKEEAFNAGALYLADNDADSIVIPARLAAALMSLFLAALVISAAWTMFGRAEAFAALALLAFEPNLIAHGSLVTTDMALTAMMFSAVFALYRYLKNPGVFSFLIVGLTVGLTLAAKHSGILILPILLTLLIVGIFLFRKTENGTRLRRQIFHSLVVFTGIIFISFVLLWTFYGFRYDALPNRVQRPNSVEEFLANISIEIRDSKSVRTVKAISRLRILPESYQLGLTDVVATNSREMFLFGKVYPTGRWFYFPVAFSIKTSIALLVLLALGLLTFKLYREHGREMLFLLIPPFFFFAVSLASQMNIGVRHILPVYPFFIVIAAAGACAWSRKHPSLRYVLVALLIFHAATAFRTAPNYLAFANDFWGGTNNTHRLLGDSNVEWGQSLKLVNEYVAYENIKDCWIAGFGSDDLVRFYQPCGVIPIGLTYTGRIADPVPPVIEGTFFLSTAFLPPRGYYDFSSVLKSEPVALIGGSIVIYQGRFEIPLVAASSHLQRAQELVRLKRFDEAVADGRKAVELAPDDPKMHVMFGLVLTHADQLDEARRAFEATIRLAESNPALFEEYEKLARAQLRRLQK